MILPTYNPFSSTTITGKAESKEDWEKFKVEFNHDMEELGNAFKDLTVKNTK